jgi:ArsR family transcriptional regulator
VKKNDYKAFADIFKALSHPVRLRIVCGLLYKSECNVSTMVELLNVAQPSISQHLNILKSARIIEGFRNGNQICYKVTNEEVIKIMQTIGCKSEL